MPLLRSKRPKPVWIFDLDDTLHHATPAIFPHINKTMTAYLVKHLQISEAEANQLRVQYWHKYGATLNGMMRHHQTDPHHFLRETHLVHVLAPLAKAQPGLHALLRQLPGRKFIFTNGPQHYARALLRAMKIDAYFEAIISIETMRFYPKPQRPGYLHLFKRHRLNPRQCVMVDDSHDNIHTARRLGMRGIWLGKQHRPNSTLPRIKSLQQLRRLK